MSEIDIKLIPTEELMDELLNRFDHAVFIGRKELDLSETGEYYSLKKYRGSFHMNLGMLSSLTSYLNKKLDEESRIVDDEEKKDC